MGTFVTPEPLKGRFCACCGMPIERPGDSGTGRSSGGSRFCRYCARGRAFTDVATGLDRTAPATDSPMGHPPMGSPKMIRRAKAWLKNWRTLRPRY
jgi:hypothetical protein